KFSLSSGTGSVIASGGSTQSTAVSTTFGAQLQATVTDGNGNPGGGAIVTFAAPGSGASATFSSPASVTTNSAGIATSPALTANSQAGAYTVTATVSGVGTAAVFNLTNTVASGTGGSLVGSGNSSEGEVNL